MLTRRSFLKNSSLISLSPLIPCVFGEAARAATGCASEKILVVVQLDGGNDGINTVVPFGDDGYGRSRKKLRLDEKGLLKLNDHVGLHTSMRAAKELFDDGRLSIVQGVGYPNPNRSHFESMKIWHTGYSDAAKSSGYGWLGRTLDRVLTPTIGDAAANSNSRYTANDKAQSIFVGEQEAPVALWGRRSTATTLSRIEDLQLSGNFSLGDATPDLKGSSDDLRPFVTKQVLTAHSQARDFGRRINQESANKSKYPATELGSQFQLISTLLKCDSQARVYYTLQSGYDTHSVQLNTHAQLLRELSDAMKAFLDDLRDSELEHRVMVLAFSEFGRRLQENDSAGTDHGTAGPVFLAGRDVAAGLIGGTPSLSDLQGGDLKMTTDFRSVYAAVLDQWLDVDSSDVLGREFKALRLFD